MKKDLDDGKTTDSESSLGSFKQAFKQNKSHAMTEGIYCIDMGAMGRFKLSTLVVLR